MTKKEYYSKLVPQSTYRQASYDEISQKEKHIIDFSLPKLSIKQDSQKQLLKSKIAKLDQQILDILLPEHIHQKAKSDGHLKNIYKKLGI